MCPIPIPNMQRLILSTPLQVRGSVGSPFAYLYLLTRISQTAIHQVVVESEFVRSIQFNPIRHYLIC